MELSHVIIFQKYYMKIYFLHERNDKILPKGIIEDR